MSQDKSQPNPDWITPSENEAKTHYWGDSKFHEMIKSHIDKLAEARQIAIENLTRDQFADALIQAIQSGDFQRLVYKDSQKVIYTPYAECCLLRREIERLKALLESHGIKDDENRC